jgi:flagellar biosynthesis anti-sigma factor FlgM
MQWQTGAEMDINKINKYPEQQVAKVQEVENKTAEHNKSASRKDPAPAESSDRVQLSRGYQELNKVKKVTMELSDIRTERVDHIRNMIANNTYPLETSKIADKMLDELI